MSFEYRSATLLEQHESEQAADGIKTLRALAVPYSEEFNEVAPGMFERFTPGALTPGAIPMKLRLEHETTIGKITRADDTEAGLEIEAVISDTSAGRDAATLLEDGVLTAVSIGFNPDYESADIKSRDDGALYITHKRAELLEVSLVSFPAYKGATINQIRNHHQEKENPPMETENTPQLAELNTRMADLEREIEATRSITTPLRPTHPLAAYRSAGEYMKAYAANVEGVRAFADDATVFANVAPKPGWLDKELRLMEAKQPVTNMFTHAYDLPREGMSFDYPVIGTNTVQVAEQTAEGDTLVHGKITLGSGNVAVKTFGGYAPLSRQAIDRASATYLATIWKAQGIQYATAIESASRAALQAMLTEQAATTQIDSTLTATTLTVNEILALTLDLIDFFDDEVLWPFTGIMVSSDVFAYLATLQEDAKAFQFTGAPTDKIGTLSIKGRAGEVDGLSVVRLPAAVGAGRVAGYSSEALLVHESPNAPLRLTDERDDTNLTNIYTVYGYAAHEKQAAGIVPVKFTTAA